MSAAFEKAAEDSKKLLGKPTNDELLELYGRGHLQRSRPRHVRHEGKSHYPSHSPPRGPGSATASMMQNIRGKAKKNAWQKVVDEGISAETAQERYVALVEQLKVKYGFDENKVPDPVGN
ncbi:Acyl-CoA-binding protein, ACBP [Beauveria brongniartii RCEF 3172]|uniref:Acyl-CoA-binding protein, ACBP n=1 Tax=Beauveria brongniartii RCEF 3172 TaxID=1081107 RepID=A0A167C4K0_9HYPO|nr:Acyl-CoA-binding protein, ACBP [Beauveria brongniartii RCEF 3172]